MPPSCVRVMLLRSLQDTAINPKSRPPTGLDGKLVGPNGGVTLRNPIEAERVP